jgi:hypothetical protein
VAAADLPVDRDLLRLSKSALLVLQYKHKAGEGRVRYCLRPYPGLTIACASCLPSCAD